MAAPTTAATAADSGTERAVRRPSVPGSTTLCICAQTSIQVGPPPVLDRWKGEGTAQHGVGDE